MKHIILLITFLVVSFPSYSALFIRDLDGNTGNGHEAVYDDVLDITWLADANLAASNSFGVSTLDPNGNMFWSTGLDFIDAMNTSDGGAGYLGFNSWRLPEARPLNGISYDIRMVNGEFPFTYDGSSDRGYQLSAPRSQDNPDGQSAGFTGSELAYHYYNNLGAIGDCSGVGIEGSCRRFSSPRGLVETGKPEAIAMFKNLEDRMYWTGDEPFIEGGPFAFSFEMSDGFQGFIEKDFFIGGSVWAVADGDLGASASPVPVPAAAWLFGSALIGIGCVRRRISLSQGLRSI